MTVFEKKVLTIKVKHDIIYSVIDFSQHLENYPSGEGAPLLRE